MKVNILFQFACYIILLFGIPFYLMVYCLRCERLRMSSQKRAIEKIIEQRRIAKHYEFED